MIREYLRYHKAVLLLFLCVVVFFPLVHFLSNLPMAPMFYSIGIVSFLLFMWLLINGYQFYQRTKLLAEIMANLSSSSHHFPPETNSTDSKYQEIIEELYRTMENNRHDMEITHTKQIEYYTMWVHQIKTPIAAMRLTLQSGKGNPVVEQELFKIEQYAEMALQYIKLNNLEYNLVIEDYKLQDIVKASVKKYATLFIHKDLSVEIEGDLTVVTDSKWLSFIIEQLLSNAVKYTNRGGVKLYCENNALIIEDTGIGIWSRDIERIFEKGYTGYNGRLDNKASGIGLYMAKKVADSLSIKLQITSVVGTGTKVELRFPQNIERVM